MRSARLESEQELLQAHRLGPKDAHVHRLRVAHDRLEVHMRQDVALDVDAGRDFDQLHAARRALEDATLGHVEHGLAGLGGVGAAEGDLLDRLDELVRRAFAHDAKRAVLDRDLQAAGGERAGEDQLLRVLGDVDEAAGAGELAAEPADIDVAVARRPAPCRGRRDRGRRRRRSRIAGSDGSRPRG